MVQAGGHHPVQEVVDAGDAVEHAPHLPRLECSGAGHGRRYFSCDRKATIALNFCGGRCLNDGIGAVGLTSVRAIPWRGIREPMCVSSGPGPSLPFSPIL